MINESETKKEDEIGLLDIFAVLLRYRKLIIGITLCAVIFAAAVYFVYPVYKNSKNSNVTRIQRTQGRIVLSVHLRARPYMSRYIITFLSDSDFFLDSFIDAGLDNIKYSKTRISLNTKKASDESAVLQQIFVTDEKDRAKASYLIDRFLWENKNLNNKDYVKEENIEQRILLVYNLDNYNVALIFRNEDREFVEKLLQAVFVRANALISENIRPMAELAVKDYENFLNIPVMSESVRQLLEREYQNYVFLKNFLDGNISPLMIIGKTITSEPDILFSKAKGSYKQALIIVLAGFVLAVALAFVLNAIRNIKNDEEAMKKIRDAWGSSKTQ